MAKMGRHCLNQQTLFTLRCILQRHFFYSSSPTTVSTTASDSLSSLQNFLVGSLGFSDQRALSTSTKLTKHLQSKGAKKVSGFNFLNNADLVVRFLQQKGFDKPQLRDLVSSVPTILASKVQQTLEPKINFFQDLGLSVSQVADVISTQPRILLISLDSTIRPLVETLRIIMGSNDDVIGVIKGFPRTSNAGIKNLVRNVSLLQAQGITIESIRKRILQQPSPFFVRHQLFKDKMVESEEKWGVSPSSSRFLHAIHVLICLNEKNIESKCGVFESFGWERSNLIHLFRSNPYCLAASGEMIKAKLSFFMEEVDYNPRDIARRPNLMNYSFKKRVLPRHLVLKLLKGKGLIRENLSLYGAIILTEPQFLKRFIHPFENDVPNLRKIYIDSIGSSAKKQGE